MGPGRHFVHYPVACGRVLNFVGLIEQDAWETESWTEPGDRRVLARGLSRLASASARHHRGRRAAFKWALLDRMPLPRWSFGASRCLATPATRCCRSSARARRRPSRMAPALTSLSCHVQRRRRRGTEALRNGAAAAHLAGPADLARQQGSLPPARRAGPAGARCQDGDREPPTGPRNRSPGCTATTLPSCRIPPQRHVDGPGRADYKHALAARALAAADIFKLSSGRRVHGQHLLRTQSHPQNRAAHPHQSRRAAPEPAARFVWWKRRSKLATAPRRWTQ